LLSWPFSRRQIRTLLAASFYPQEWAGPTRSRRARDRLRAQQIMPRDSKPSNHPNRSAAHDTECSYVEITFTFSCIAFITRASGIVATGSDPNKLYVSVVPRQQHHRESQFVDATNKDVYAWLMGGNWCLLRDHMEVRRDLQQRVQGRVSAPSVIQNPTNRNT
jgi:hypothetical protein